jgi:predicted AAA+ superfamily ATPase
MKNLTRRAEAVVQTALADTRVVVVNGARQVGKTTLVKAITKDRANVVVRSFDRSADLQAARHDPEAFVLHDGLMVIDEIQRAPEVVLPIKASVDESNRPGQFLLTGSARLLGLRALPDALVGRAETIELWPFSQGEIDGCADGFVDAVFGDHDRFGRVGQSVRDELLERATRGGFPEATKRANGRRQRFFASYVNDLIDRDVTQLGDIQRRGDLDRLLRLLAGRMATGLKVDNLASQSGIPTTTLERYLTLFEEVFLIKRVGPWSNSATSRAVRMRKLIFVDSGLAASLSGRSVTKLAREPALAGPLLENFVLGELARQLTWSTVQASLRHYRTRDGEEVDAILECADGRIVGVEVKASSTVKAEDFRHLEHLLSRAPDQFHRGVVLYTGERMVPFGRRLVALPIDALWRAPG